jgi:hypothetical protein
MYTLSYYIPEADHERVKKILFTKGAGKIGQYDQCCWVILGCGQFRALAGSQPYVGIIGQVEILAEYKVEMVCSEACISAVIQALLKAHPYEQPAYFVSQVMTLEQLNENDLKLKKSY